MSKLYDLHDAKLCIVLVISMFIGFFPIHGAAILDTTGYLFAASWSASMLLIHLLPETERLPARFNKEYLVKLRYDPLVLLFVLWFGPMAATFIFITSLLPAKKCYDGRN